MKADTFIKYIVIAFYSILVLITLWFPYHLFHYEHKYKVITKEGVSTIVFTDSKFEVGDKIKYQTQEHGSYEGYNYTWGDQYIGTITKIER